MVNSPSKYLQRHFLRDLKQSYYVSKGGKEYFPEDVDYMLAEKENRLALIEYNAEMRKIAAQHSDSGIIKGLPPMLSSNDAPNFICADTIFPLKKLPVICFHTAIETTLEESGPMKTTKKARYNEREITKAEWLKELEKAKAWLNNHAAL